MTEAQSTAAKERYRRESDVICPMCDGKGRILSQSVKGRAVKAGNASYRKSLEPGQMSMSERGKLGGRPRAITIESLGLSDDFWKEGPILGFDYEESGSGRVGGAPYPTRPDDLDPVDAHAPLDGGSDPEDVGVCGNTSQESPASIKEKVYG